MPITGDNLLLADGTSNLLLVDGTSGLLLTTWTAPPAPAVGTGWTVGHALLIGGSSG